MALSFSVASSNPCQVEAPPEHRPIVFPEARPSPDRRKSSSPLLPSKVDDLKKQQTSQKNERQISPMRLSHSNTEAKTESQMTKYLQAHIHQKENPSETRKKTSN
jgi:hypothetical protein